MCSSGLNLRAAKGRYTYTKTFAKLCYDLHLSVLSLWSHWVRMPHSLLGSTLSYL
ncbi:hypothetical protein E2C01_088991 [Portunus trituberculatus]|uniref:Uncharacterized protein n=1 Tax=Portunus trituberculatus TaxID=210409 RepID=A0A5B7JHX4_PORTR|nr:hypothetical protein [Portunus trituberculatus]